MTMTKHQKKEQDSARRRASKQMDEQERVGPVKMWRDNMVANEYEIELSEIVEKFVASPYYATKYLHSWPLQRIIRAFITSSDGLSSVFNEADYERIHEAIRKRVFPKG